MVISAFDVYGLMLMFHFLFWELFFMSSDQRVNDMLATMVSLGDCNILKTTFRIKLCHTIFNSYI